MIRQKYGADQSNSRDKIDCHMFLFLFEENENKNAELYLTN